MEQSDTDDKGFSLLTRNGQVFVAILENPDVRQREIAEMLDMKLLHVWRSIRALVEAGVLEVERSGRKTIYRLGKELENMEDVRRLKTCVLL